MLFRDASTCLNTMSVTTLAVSRRFTTVVKQGCSVTFVETATGFICLNVVVVATFQCARHAAEIESGRAWTGGVSVSL